MTYSSSPNQRWDYYVMHVDVSGFFGPNINPQQLGDYLSEAGNDGWELVNTVDINQGEGRTTAILAIFKRSRL